MHTYRLISEPDELERVIGPVLKSNGSEIPARGCYIAAVEFDEQGNVVAYQLLQNALFLEGLWAADASAHLLTLYHMATEYAEKTLKVKQIMTMTRNDERGRRIGRLAERLGLRNMNLLVYRKEL